MDFKLMPQWDNTCDLEGMYIYICSGIDLVMCIFLGIYTYPSFLPVLKSSRLAMIRR